jgi:glutathione S-transferase
VTLVIYDLCGAGDLRFSPYCFRAKMALAIKGLPYSTIPVPFTDIAGIGRGSFKTVPVLVDGDLMIGDSFAIAEHLDAHYPGPALFGSGEEGRAAARLIEGLMNGLVQPQLTPLMGASIHSRLQEADKAYFRASREQRIGKPLEAAEAERAVKLPEVRKRLVPLRHALRERPFLGGEQPMMLDAIPFGTFAWAAAVGALDLAEGDDLLAGWFERCMRFVPVDRRG